MPIQLEFTPQPGYLYARATGDFQSHDLAPALATIFDEYARATLRGVLIDVFDLHGDLPTMERYKVGVLYADHARKIAVEQAGRRPRIAIVGQPPLYDPQRFVETVATNRGVALRVFTDLGAATAWLEGD